MTRGSRRGPARLAVAALAAISALPLVGGPPVAAATPTDLFISEYVEGPGFDQAIEIYNGTGGTISLLGAMYRLDFYLDGSTTPGSAIELSGSIPAGGVYVVAHPQASPAILAVANQISTLVTFDGNDAVILSSAVSGGPIDIFGQVGVDPGPSGWGMVGVATADQTLRRKPTVTAGRTSSGAFDPSLEWVAYEAGVYSGLGSHPVGGGDPVSAGGVVDAIVTVPTSAACLELSTTSIEFGAVALGSSDVPAAPTIEVTNCSGSTGLVYARGTDATGLSAAWDLVDSAETCAGALGMDAYHLRLAGPGTVQLSTENKSIGTIAAGATTNQTARIDTACPGSTGAGTTMTFEILFLATEG